MWCKDAGTKSKVCLSSTCVLTFAPLVCFDSVDRIQQLKREYQLARREGMVAPYEEPDPRRRGLENDLHRVRSWNSLAATQLILRHNRAHFPSFYLFVLSSGCFYLSQTSNQRMPACAERARVRICQGFHINYQSDHYFYCICSVIKAAQLSATRCSLTLMGPAGTELITVEAIGFLLRIRHRWDKLVTCRGFFGFVFPSQDEVLTLPVRSELKLPETVAGVILVPRLQ